MISRTVSKRVSFGTKIAGPKFKALRVSKLCPEKAATQYQPPSGLRFEASPKNTCPELELISNANV
jgi:hypothetical protein